MTLVSATVNSDQDRFSHKPSFRQRLFSRSSRKSVSRPSKSTEGDEKDGQDVVHVIENSGSTSITLTPESPVVSDEGQGPGLRQPSTSSASPDAALRMQADDNDREQGSLNTTLSGHHKRVPFYRRRVNKSSVSEGAVSSTTSHSISKQKARITRPRPSLLSRVVSKVVPCVGSDEANVPVREQSDTMAEYKAPREVSGVKPSELVVSLPSSLDNNQGPPHIDTSQALMVPANPTQPPSPAESEIIVPPPPSAQLLPEDETDGLTSGAVQPPGSTGDIIARTFTRDSDDTDGTHFTDDEGEDSHSLEEQAEEERLIRNGGSGIPIGPDGVPRPLLPPIAPEHVGRKCLVLDLDETLVHSSFKPIPHPDFIVPVEIETHWHHFHVLKRPGVDLFLKEMGEIYEVVVFTASLSKYADPVLDQLDISNVVAHRLFRESCFSHNGNYVKDLSQLGRPIADTIILDNSPASYIFHPTNAVPVSSWFNDPHDAELTDLIPFLADLTAVPDVRPILDSTR